MEQSFGIERSTTEAIKGPFGHMQMDGPNRCRVKSNNEIITNDITEQVNDFEKILQSDMPVSNAYQDFCEESRGFQSDEIGYAHLTDPTLTLFENFNPNESLQKVDANSAIRKQSRKTQTPGISDVASNLTTDFASMQVVNGVIESVNSCLHACDDSLQPSNAKNADSSSECKSLKDDDTQAKAPSNGEPRILEISSDLQGEKEAPCVNEDGEMDREAHLQYKKAKLTNMDTNANFEIPLKCDKLQHTNTVIVMPPSTEILKPVIVNIDSLGFKKHECEIAEDDSFDSSPEAYEIPKQLVESKQIANRCRGIVKGEEGHTLAQTCSEKGETKIIDKDCSGSIEEVDISGSDQECMETAPELAGLIFGMDSMQVGCW